MTDTNNILPSILIASIIGGLSGSVSGTAAADIYRRQLEHHLERSERSEPGPIGPAGAPGLTAYQIWLSLGNLGTPQDFINSIGTSFNPSLTNLQNQINIIGNQSLLQSSYQFRYSLDSGHSDVPFYVIGAGTALTSSSVPEGQGRISTSHTGYLADDDILLTKLILTIRGASTNTVPSIVSNINMNFEIHTWNATNTSIIPFSVSIPQGSINGTLDPSDASLANSDIVYVTSTFASPINISEGTIFGLKFKTPSIPSNTVLSSIDNTYIKLIFRAV